MDDAQLLHDYAEKGSDRAFAELVGRHVDLVYSAALRQCDGDPHRAKEVTQMVFTDLARKAGKLSKHPLLIGWLHRSTRWAASQLRREERRRAAKQGAFTEYQRVFGETEAAADWDRIRPLIDEALDELKEGEREAILLRFFGDRSFSEVGLKLGINENTARMRVNRALEKLQGALVRRGVSSTTAALGVALAQNTVSAAPAGMAELITSAAIGEATVVAGLGALANFFLMTKIQAGILGILGLCLGLGTYCNLKSESNLGVQLAAAEQKTANLRNSISEVESTIQRLENQQAEEDSKTLAKTDPVLAERYSLDLIIRKGDLDQRYLWLFKRLHLPPEQLDKLKGLIVERNQAIYDAGKLAKLQGLADILPSEQGTFDKEAAADVDVRIGNLVGSDGLAYLQSYDRMGGLYESFMSGHVNSFTLSLGYSISGYSLEAMQKAEDAAQKFQDLVGADLAAHSDACYLANDPLPLPESYYEKASTLLTAKQLSDSRSADEFRKVMTQMSAITRVAAAEGRLNLSKSSANEYGVSRKAKVRTPQTNTSK